MKGAHFLAEDVGLFDAAFFGYSGETAAVSALLGQLLGLDAY